MSRATRPIAFAGFVLVVACSTATRSSGEMLQSSCVRENVTLGPALADGEDCYNVGYSDCPSGDYASACIHVCAFDVCQATACRADADCASFGAAFECMPYVVSRVSYGSWCGKTTCPKGTVGCPCGAGGACHAPDAMWTVRCNVKDECEGEDSCASGCRADAICCGGASCSGSCVGTPCCR